MVCPANIPKRPGKGLPGRDKLFTMLDGARAMTYNGGKGDKTPDKTNLFCDMPQRPSDTAVRRRMS